MRAYVLVQTDGEPVAERLRTLPGIVSADDLRGAYDAIALARSPSMRHLVEEVIPQIKEIRGVRRALPVPLAGSSGEPESSRAPDRAASARPGVYDRPRLLGITSCVCGPCRASDPCRLKNRGG